jgi:hypothetical protein
MDATVTCALSHLRRSAGCQVTSVMPRAVVRNDGRRASAKRTALVLLSIVLVFFFGIMIKIYIFGK